jgi:hypothetical protein
MCCHIHKAEASHKRCQSCFESWYVSFRVGMSSAITGGKNLRLLYDVHLPRFRSTDSDSVVLRESRD